MNQWIFLGLTVFAGVMLGFQSPINAALSKRVGLYESALISFSVGVICLVLVVAIFGRGNIRTIIHVPWWQWLGGILGVIYVTTIIMAVPRIGVTSAMVAILVGQLATGLVIDNYGWFGVSVRSLDWHRLSGLGLLVVSLWLIYAKK